jgi:hypothetical protein
MKCGDSERWSFNPDKIQLFNTSNKLRSDIPLKRFTWYQPGALTPDVDNPPNASPIGRTDRIECKGGTVPAMSAAFDFDPSLTQLEVNFNGSLATVDRPLYVPPIRLTLMSGKEWFKDERAYFWPAVI